MKCQLSRYAHLAILELVEFDDRQRLGRHRSGRNGRS